MKDLSPNHALQRTASAPSVRASREFVSAPCAPPPPPRPALSVKGHMNKLALNLLLCAFPLSAAFAGDSTNVEPQVVRDIRARLPAGWNCVVYQAKDVKAVPHGLGKPVFQVVATNTNLSFVKSEAPLLTKQSPVIPLYFYRHSEKADLMQIIEKERMYSWSIPIYFGETDEFLVVTSPAFVNGGVFTPEARHALRPMWKVLRELIPNKEKTGVDELAADS